MKNRIQFLYKIGLFILFLQSLSAWFLWNKIIFVFLLSFCITLIYIIIEKEIFIFKRSFIVPLIILIIVEFYVVKHSDFNAIIAAFLRVFILSIVLISKDKLKIELFNFFTKAFAFILAISLFFWFLFLLGVKLPYSIVDYNESQYLFNNHYLYLFNLKSPINILISRFSSIFLEPGHLGMITTFFIIGNSFELKKIPVFIIFLATIFTFSLAAYVLLFIGALIFFFGKSQKPLLNILIFSVIFSVTYLFFTNVNNGNNAVNKLIFDRLEVKKELVSSRFTSNFDNFYKKYYKSTDKIFGIGPKIYIKKSKKDWGHNAGYKVFIIQYGILGTILVFLFYFSIVLIHNTKMSWILLFVYILCFVQAAYPLWESEILIFITALPLYAYKKQLE